MRIKESILQYLVEKTKQLEAWDKVRSRECHAE